MPSKPIDERRVERAARGRANRHNYFMNEITNETDPRRRLEHAIRFVRALADDMTAEQLDRIGDEMTDLAQKWANT